jgi:hypothetical protein
LGALQTKPRRDSIKPQRQFVEFRECFWCISYAVHDGFFGGVECGFRSWCLAAVTFCSITLSLATNDWPQWRGPKRDGISKEIGLLKEWPEAGPALLWQAKDLSEDYSTPAVVGNRLYIISNRGLRAIGKPNEAGGRQMPASG